jgi:hypothetical protein
VPAGTLVGACADPTFLLDIRPKGAHGRPSLGVFRAPAVTPELRGSCGYPCDAPAARQGSMTVRAQAKVGGIRSSALRGCGRFRGPKKQGGMEMHKFKVGQSVQYNGGAVRRIGVSGTFKIVKLLPPEGDDQQYCIKSSHEPHERIAKESQLNHAS